MPSGGIHNTSVLYIWGGGRRSIVPVTFLLVTVILSLLLPIRHSPIVSHISSRKYHLFLIWLTYHYFACVVPNNMSSPICDIFRIFYVEVVGVGETCMMMES